MAHLGIFAGDGKAIKINRNGHDVGDRVMVGDGDVRFPVRPYVRAMTFFRGKAKFNALLLGWDWRRNLLAAVDILNAVIETIKKTKSVFQEPTASYEKYLYCWPQHGGHGGQAVLSDPPERC